MLGRKVLGMNHHVQSRRTMVELIYTPNSRVLTAREMARLQSFPDDFIFEGTKNKQLVQIGNAVPPLLGKAIGLAVRFSDNDL